MSRVRTDPEQHQAICDQCGWHTVPMRQRDAVERLGELHDKVCPAPPPPRIGAVMECGCWTFKVVGGNRVGDVALCDVHGVTNWRQMNVPEGVSEETP